MDSNPNPNSYAKQDLKESNLSEGELGYPKGIFTLNSNEQHGQIDRTFKFTPTNNYQSNVPQNNVLEYSNIFPCDSSDSKSRSSQSKSEIVKSEVSSNNSKEKSHKFKNTIPIMFANIYEESKIEVKDNSSKKYNKHKIKQEDANERENNLNNSSLSDSYQSHDLSNFMQKADLMNNDLCKIVNLNTGTKNTKSTQDSKFCGESNLNASSKSVKTSSIEQTAKIPQIPLKSENSNFINNKTSISSNGNVQQSRILGVILTPNEIDMKEELHKVSVLSKVDTSNKVILRNSNKNIQSFQNNAYLNYSLPIQSQINQNNNKPFVNNIQYNSTSSDSKFAENNSNSLITMNNIQINNQVLNQINPLKDVNTNVNLNKLSQPLNYPQSSRLFPTSGNTFNYSSSSYLDPNYLSHQSQHQFNFNMNPYNNFNNSTTSLHNAPHYNSSGQVNPNSCFNNQLPQYNQNLQPPYNSHNIGSNKTYSYSIKNTPINAVCNNMTNLNNVNYSTAYSSSNSGNVPNLQGQQINTNTVSSSQNQNQKVFAPIPNKSLFYNAPIINSSTPQIIPQYSQYYYGSTNTPSHIIQNPNYSEKQLQEGGNFYSQLNSHQIKSSNIQNNSNSKKKSYLSQHSNYNQNHNLNYNLNQNQLNQDYNININSINSNISNYVSNCGDLNSIYNNDFNQLSDDINFNSLHQMKENTNCKHLVIDNHSESASYSQENSDEDNEDKNDPDNSLEKLDQRTNSNNDLILENLKNKALKQIKLLDISSIMNSDKEDIEKNGSGDYDGDNCGKFSKRNPKDEHLELKSSIKINFKNYEFFSTSTSKDLYNCITTKLGSKLAQDYIGSCPDNEVEAFYDKIKEYIFALIENKYSNFFFQKLIYSLNKNLRLQFTYFISKNIIYMSNHKLGNRSIQALIYSVDCSKEEKIVLSYMEDKFEKLAFNKFGSFVLSTILQTFSDESISSLVKFLNSKFLSLITNEFALYLIKSYVSKAKENKKLRKKIIKAFLENFVTILKSKHGYYGILYVLENWGIENSQKVVNIIELNFELLLGTNLYNLLKKIFKTNNQVSE